MSDDVLFEQINHWGVITLNREKALNALTHPMVIAMRHQLANWEDDEAIAAVMIRGAGQRAFCAGGDIRWLYDSARQDVSKATAFFRDEYSLNAAIYNFKKPYLALIDGIVMGGGVGVSVHGDYRIAGDNTLFAMPETGIGLFPDVGGGYFLPRLDGGLGLYFALTGARAKAADMIHAKIATHYVATPKQDELQSALLAIDLTNAPELEQTHDKIRSCLEIFHEDIADAPLAEHTAQIDRLFQGHENLEALIDALAGQKEGFASDTLATLSKMSPTSLRLTFEQMRRGASHNFADTMKMEFRIVNKVMRNADFFEGVRALIIDKDRNPKWSPETLSDIGEGEIAAYFENLGPEELEV